MRPVRLAVTLSLAALAGCTQPANPPTLRKPAATAEPAAASPATPAPRATVPGTAASARPSTAPQPTPTGDATAPVSGAPSTRPAASAAPSDPAVRATVDRLDDGAGLQIHLIYAVPKDGEDRQLDTDGTLAASVTRIDSWMRGQADGHVFNVDRAQGRPDVSFFRSKLTKAELMGTDGLAIDRLRPELAEAGFDHPQKVYGVYCALPGPGNVAGHGGNGIGVAYLGSRDAEDGGLNSTPGPSGIAWYDGVLVHELLHALGHVDVCAPHHQADTGGADKQGHVMDDKTDLMSAVESNGLIALDVGHDDYYGHGRAGCSDLAKSPFLAPLPADAVPPPGRPLALDAGPTALKLIAAAAGTATAADTEVAAVKKVEAAWAAAGRTLPPLDPVLVAAARRMATARAAGDTTPGARHAARAGYFGPFGATFLGLTRVPDFTLDETVAALVDGLKPASLLPGADTVPTGWGIAIASSDANVYLAIVWGTGALAPSELALDEGPLATYTLTGKIARRPGARATQAILVVDGEATDWSIRLDAAGEGRFAASLTRGAVHQVVIGTFDGKVISHDVTFGPLDARKGVVEAGQGLFDAPTK